MSCLGGVEVYWWTFTYDGQSNYHTIAIIHILILFSGAGSDFNCTVTPQEVQTIQSFSKKVGKFWYSFTMMVNENLYLEVQKVKNKWDLPPVNVHRFQAWKRSWVRSVIADFAPNSKESQVKLKQYFTERNKYFVIFMVPTQIGKPEKWEGILKDRKITGKSHKILETYFRQMSDLCIIFSDI